MFTILVVEDDSSLNKMICAKLNKEQFKAIPAFDGEQALDVMDREHIDLIISDVMMPNMDGYELTRLLRDTSYLKRIIELLNGSIECRSVEGEGTEMLVKVPKQQPDPFLLRQPDRKLYAAHQGTNRNLKE